MKITSLIIAGILGTALASQGTILYTEDFDPAPGPDATGSGFVYWNGSPDEYWTSAANLVNFTGDLTLDGQGLAGGRGRGAVVWLDASSWTVGRIGVTFDVSEYSAIDGAQTYFRAYYANNLAGGNEAGFDVHQPFGVDLATDTNGALAEMGPLGGKNLITGNGTDVHFTFEYTGQEEVALVFYTTGEVASFDNISVAHVPEPSTVLLFCLGGWVLYAARKRFHRS